jgi:hypothetical protein
VPTVSEEASESNKRYESLHSPLGSQGKTEAHSNLVSAKYHGSPSGTFASSSDSFSTPYNQSATLPYGSQHTTSGYQQRAMDQQTPHLRTYAGMDNMTQQFPRPADTPLSTLQDSGQSITGHDLGFPRRHASMAQPPPHQNLFRSLTQGHDNFTFSASPSMPSMTTSASIPQYTPNSHLPTIGLPLPVSQSTGASHQPHDSVLMGPAQFNHSDALGQSGSLYPDSSQLPLPEPYPMARYDGQQQMSAGEGSLYTNMNNLAQGPEAWQQSTG